MANSKFLPPKGFRDHLPEEMAIRRRATAILADVFERYGFQPLETPTLEYASTLMGKYGAEADKLLYLFRDRGGRDVGLNYDLTVPTARVLAAYPQLVKPFKRYQIQPAYRAENPQKGRYRQFTQCDIDTIGSDSPLADAEILAVINDSLEALGLANFTIYLNSRPVLYNLCKSLAVKENDWNTLLQTVDKADKLSVAGLNVELSKKGFGDEFYSQQIKPFLDEAEANFLDSSLTGDSSLDEVYKAALEMGVPGPNLKFKPTIVRGLDYYTGSIFETVVREPKLGSVTGGGRYDNLIAQLGGPKLTAVGSTIGLDRICDVISELKLWPKVSSRPQVLVTIFAPQFKGESLKLSQALRDALIATEVYLDPKDRLDKQLKYADKRGIPYCLIVGDEEVKNKVAVLKDMSTGDQESLPLVRIRERLSHHEAR